MVFNSLPFFVFLICSLFFVLIVKNRYRWIVLLLISYSFYGFLLNPILLVVLTSVILITFLFGILIEKSNSSKAKLKILWFGILLNISFLLYFKYFSFIVQNFNIASKFLGINLIFKVPSILVSVGFSFFIFQAISYLVDIYFQIIKAERHLGYFALFMAFFPKLLQGPIERATDLLLQIKNYKFILSYENVRLGIFIFACGLFKKVVIADRLGILVNSVYNNLHEFNGISLIFATYAYAFQILMDFSGYTDMALGTALLFNIKLTQNFNSPYLARSVTDFWRRWHITFSHWILDYIFVPLQMKFRNFGKVGSILALIITFALAGIWHGANWTFIIFGLIHGVYLSFSFIFKSFKKKVYKKLGITDHVLLKLFQIFITFNLVSISWIFFRANNISEAWYVLTNLFVFSKNYFFISSFLHNNFIIFISICAILFMGTADYLFSQSVNRNIFFQKPIWFRWAFYSIIFYGIEIFGVFSRSQFIYFQF